MVSRRSRLRYKTNIFFLNKLSKFILVSVIGAIVFIFFLFIWISRDLPTPGKLSASNLTESTKILDRNGIVLYDVFNNNQNRTYVELSEIPKTLQEATIAIEDKDFYTNLGFSVGGYFRNVLNLLTLQRVGGGSTLTQQLVKNTLLTPERTLTRKLKELILAIQVDRTYKKTQILELYLNVAPYGGTAVGIEAGAEQYFGKKAKDLDLMESAILAGFPQLPSFYSPYGPYPKAYINRTKDVLRRMREDKYITRKQEIDAVALLDKVKFVSKPQSIRAPHFSFYVKDLLVKQFGENMVEQGGLRVTTTLDYKLQKTAEEIVKEEVEAAKSLKVGNGASLVVDPKNGEILAMVGSKDFFSGSKATEKNKSQKSNRSQTDDEEFEGQYNVVVQGLRQPGSSIKPITYATALEKGYTASSLIMDTKTVFPDQGGKDYTPVNYDGKYHGPVQMRFALGSSLNIPAVKTLALVGIKSMLTTAYSMGLTTLAPTDENSKRFGLSITLGGGEIRMLEMGSSYSAFANGGYKVDSVAILKVTDRKGKVLYENKTAGKKRVISEEVAFIISHMLMDNNARLLTFGENSYLNIRGREIAVKTGTTDDKRDNWTIGWTPNTLVVTWVGNNDNSPMGNVASGVTGAAPIWRRIILEAIKNKPNEEFVQPSKVTAVTIDAFGGGLPVDGKPTRAEYFIKGTEPQAPSSIYKTMKVSKADGNKLASDSEIAKNDYDTRKFVVFSENDPVSADGKNRWQEGIDTWLSETDPYKNDPLYEPPKEKSDRIVQDTPTPAPTSAPTSTPVPTSISPTLTVSPTP